MWKKVVKPDFKILFLENLMITKCCPRLFPWITFRYFVAICLFFLLEQWR